MKMNAVACAMGALAVSAASPALAAPDVDIPAGFERGVVAAIYPLAWTAGRFSDTARFVSAEKPKTEGELDVVRTDASFNYDVWRKSALSSSSLHRVGYKIGAVIAGEAREIEVRVRVTPTLGSTDIPKYQCNVAVDAGNDALSPVNVLNGIVDVKNQEATTLLDLEGAKNAVVEAWVACVAPEGLKSEGERYVFGGAPWGADTPSGLTVTLETRENGGPWTTKRFVREAAVSPAMSEAAKAAQPQQKARRLGDLAGGGVGGAGWIGAVSAGGEVYLPHQTDHRYKAEPTAPNLRPVKSTSYPESQIVVERQQNARVVVVEAEATLDIKTPGEYIFGVEQSKSPSARYADNSRPMSCVSALTINGSRVVESGSPNYDNSYWSSGKSPIGVTEYGGAKLEIGKPVMKFRAVCDFDIREADYVGDTQPFRFTVRTPTGSAMAPLSGLLSRR